MHKLAKGLKKKKKKKDKRALGDDDFDPEELERYKRERAEAQQKQLESGTDKSGAGGEVAAGSDEWKKFQALTAGVDSILKKTQGDLDRIKSTSFFQRKPVESEIKFEDDSSSIAKVQGQSKKWLNFDKDGNPIEDTDDTTDTGEVDQRKSLETAFVEVPEDDDEQEDSVEEDIFDTTYVDVLQNIDVQLAYIPDSPTEEEIGDDPFDTTNADKVLKTVDKKTGKKLLSLGNAVEVLAGRIDHVSTCKIGRNRKPQQSVDLLLDESADTEKPEAITVTEQTNEPVSKTLLDDDEDLPDVPIDLTKLPPVLPRPVTPVSSEGNENIKKTEQPPIDISEFEVLKEKTILEEIPNLEDDEFDLNAEIDEKVVLDDTVDPFAEKESVNPELEEEIAEVSFIAKSNAEGEDPFDTAFAENILPGKTELKFIEKELEELPISEVSISLTDPAGLKRDYETGLLKLTEDPIQSLNVKKQDLLGSSSTDLTQLADEPIAPVEEITYVDPFDTSAVEELPPGKGELKFLEKELLGENQSSGTTHSVPVYTLDDDDFDPRKEEPPIIAVQNTSAADTVQPRKASRPDVLSIAPVKTVEFTLPTPSNRPDLLTSSEDEKHIPAKPLTPYYSQKSLEETLPEGEEDEAGEVDPFDTNFVSKIAPGKTELKLLESELLSEVEPVLKHNLSDQEFDPRAEQVAATQQINQTEVSKRAEFASQRQESILDAEVDVTAKPLSPNIQSKVIEEEEISYVDPFDTSIAKNILPGKAELKILENELSQVQETIPVLPNPLDLVANLVDEDDFDPRAGETKEFTDYLCLDDQGVADKVLTPLQDDAFSEDIDPFDTSFATITPGKTELKLLESELVTK